MRTSSNLSSCFPSFITQLYEQTGCEWATDSKRLSARSIISWTSVLLRSRPARHCSDDELAMDEEDKEECRDDPMSIDERLEDMTFHIVEKTFEQTELRAVVTQLVRRFDRFEATPPQYCRASLPIRVWIHQSSPSGSPLPHFKNFFELPCPVVCPEFALGTM